MLHFGDELHHMGWNICSSCHSDKEDKRKYLILPGLISSNIYIVDVATDERKP
jgi:selenium-binding protein 1